MKILKSKKYYILVGSDLSTLVLADILSNSKKNVILVNKFNSWGGIFLGKEINGQKFDYGMANFELMFKKKKKNIRSYDPEKFKDFVYFQQYIKDYLKPYVKFNKILQVPQMLYKNNFYNDLIISDNLDFFSSKKNNVTNKKIKSEIKPKLKKNNIMLKHKDKKFDYFLSNSLKKIALDNYGDTYYNEFIKPIVKKVLSISPSKLPSIFHRNALVPLYYPETIINGANNSKIKSHSFLYPKDDFFGKFIGRIFDKVSKKKNVLILKNCKNIKIFQKKKIIILNNNSFNYSKIFWSGDIKELAKLNNIAYNYKSVKNDKANLMIFFLIIKKKYIKKKFSFIMDVDKNCPIYRITNQSLVSGLNHKNHKITIECNPVMFKSNNLKREIKFYLKKYNIDPNGITFMEKQYFQNGLLIPSKKAFLIFNTLKRKIRKLNHNIILMGKALNYNSNTLNDQILQGIKFSNKIK